MSTARPAVSVVVPTYRRPALLARCLEALLVQDLAAERYEIVVADDGNDAPTRAEVERLARRAGGAPALRYVEVGPRHGPAAARNCGWRAAGMPVIAFTDDDTVSDPGWLTAGLAALGSDVAAVSGAIVMPLGGPCTDYERDASRLAGAEFATANCFVRRAWLAALGGFDERYTAAWREDSDLQFALLERGARIVAAPQAVVVHPIRPAGFGVSLAQQRKIRFDALLYRKYPRLYRQRIRARPQWRYYAIVAALATAVAAIAAGRPAVAATAAAAWLALTLEFCARRLRGASKDPRHVLEMLVTSAAIPPLAVFWRLIGIVQYRAALW